MENLEIIKLGFMLYFIFLIIMLFCGFGVFFEIYILKDNIKKAKRKNFYYLLDNYYEKLEEFKDFRMYFYLILTVTSYIFFGFLFRYIEIEDFLNNLIKFFFYFLNFLHNFLIFFVFIFPFVLLFAVFYKKYIKDL